MWRASSMTLPDVRTTLLERHGSIRLLIDELTADLSELTKSQVLEGVVANHPADQSSDLFEAELDLAMVRGLAAELREIDEALERLDSGTYGACVDCRQEIDAERLAVLPTARRCLDCQVRHESMHGDSL